MAGVRIVDMPDLGLVTDTTSFVGERAGSGRFSAQAVRDYAIAGISGGSGGTGIPEAPTDGSYYGRASGSWQPVAPLSVVTALQAAVTDLTTRLAYIEAHYIKPS